jgi:hypothetical protein
MRIYLLLLLIILASCGKKSGVVAPKDVPETYPRSYPFDNETKIDS